MKKLIFILLYWFVLDAKEPILAILQNIPNNQVQEFSLYNYSYECRPYGVVTIEELSYRDLKNSACSDAVKRYYRKNPVDRYFAQMNLHLQMHYHIELLPKRCILYAFGQKTYAEALLENGLAVVKPLFSDNRWKNRLNRAQLRAKIEKKGVWKSDILQACVGELSTSE